MWNWRCLRIFPVKPVASFALKLHDLRIVLVFTVSGGEGLKFNRLHRRHHGLIVKFPETWESGLGTKGKETTTVLCAVCGFQRGDRDSTPGSGRAPTHRNFPCQSKPVHSRRLQRAADSLSVELKCWIPDCNSFYKMCDRWRREQLIGNDENLTADCATAVWGILHHNVGYSCAVTS